VLDNPADLRFELLLNKVDSMAISSFIWNSSKNFLIAIKSKNNEVLGCYVKKIPKSTKFIQDPRKIKFFDITNNYVNNGAVGSQLIYPNHDNLMIGSNGLSISLKGG